jgi:hypothetical protein
VCLHRHMLQHSLAAAAAWMPVVGPCERVLLLLPLPFRLLLSLLPLLLNKLYCVPLRWLQSPYVGARLSVCRTQHHAVPGSQLLTTVMQ